MNGCEPSLFSYGTDNLYISSITKRKMVRNCQLWLGSFPYVYFGL